MGIRQSTLCCMLMSATSNPTAVNELFVPKKMQWDKICDSVLAEMMTTANNNQFQNASGSARTRPLARASEPMNDIPFPEQSTLNGTSFPEDSFEQAAFDVETNETSGYSEKRSWQHANRN